MNREEQIELLNTIKNPRLQREDIYSLLEDLGIQYKRTNCIRCLEDYLNIIKEELGLVESAAELSNFNGGYKYLKNRPFRWVRKNGEIVIINKNTPIDVIEEFITAHKGYYIRIEEK